MNLASPESCAARAFYDSVWQQPWLLGGLGVLAAVWVVAGRRPFRAPHLRAWFLVFALMSPLDAWLTSNSSPLHGALARAAAIGFVIVGDFRCFLLFTRAGGNGRAAFFRALAWSFVASVAVAIATRAAPAAFADTRHVFLLYEVLSLAIFAGWTRVLAARTGTDATVARDAARFFVVQYALWVAADVAVLSGACTAYALRVVPNVLYYGAFVPFVMLRARRAEGA